MSELGLGPFALAENLSATCTLSHREYPLLQPQNGPMEQLCSPGTLAPWDSKKLIRWSLCPWRKASKLTYILCVHVSPLQVTTSAQQRCPGRRHFPATHRSRARRTSSRCRWPAATPSATARGWCNDSRGQPAHTDSWAWSLPPGPGSRWPPLHPPFAVKTDAYQLQPGCRQCGNLERRLPRSRG